MDRKAIVRVLLVGGDPREFFASRRLFEWNGCQCHFSNSDHEAAELLNSGQFDIVLRTHEIADGNIDHLAASLSGSRASLFNSMPVGDVRPLKCGTTGPYIEPGDLDRFVRESLVTK
jgi:hypothetical protein